MRNAAGSPAADDVAAVADRLGSVLGRATGKRSLSHGSPPGGPRPPDEIHEVRHDVQIAVSKATHKATLAASGPTN